MAILKISSDMTVADLKSNFRKEFGGTLRVYNGNHQAEESLNLSMIKINGNTKYGTIECRTSRTIKKFEEELLAEYGIKVRIATQDDWVAILPEITLSKISSIKDYATTKDMESLIAYKREQENIQNKSNLKEANCIFHKKDSQKNVTNMKSIVVTISGDFLAGVSYKAINNSRIQINDTGDFLPSVDFYSSEIDPNKIGEYFWFHPDYNNDPVLKVKIGEEEIDYSEEYYNLEEPEPENLPINFNEHGYNELTKYSNEDFKDDQLFYITKLSDSVEATITFKFEIGQDEDFDIKKMIASIYLPNNMFAEDGTNIYFIAYDGKLIEGTININDDNLKIMKDSEIDMYYAVNKNLESVFNPFE